MNDILSNLSVYTKNEWADYNINALILSVIIILVPILIALIIPLFDSKLNKQAMLYLYAFTTGFFIILGLFGELNEGRELALEAAGDNMWIKVGYQLIVLVVGSVVGLGFAFGFKLFVNRKLGKYNPKSPVEQHSDHIAFHNHPHAHEFIFGNKGIKVDEKPNARDKVVALYLILSHRLAAGFFLGYTVFNIVSSNYEQDHMELAHAHAHTDHSISLAFLIGFFLHLIPEELIIYFRQREMGISRSKALINSVLVIMILVPFIFLGANVGKFVQNLWWLNGIIHVIVGVLFTFTAIIEFFPEVVRETVNQKLWYTTILSFILGLISCLIVISFGH